MRTLAVSTFSSLAHAEIKIDRLTVLIGPQASGKSLLSKLALFFEQSLYLLRDSAFEHRPYREAKKLVGVRFREWFPPSAWGKHAFNVEYVIGEHVFKVSRKTYKKKLVGDDVLHVSVPSQLQSLYEETIARA